MSTSILREYPVFCCLKTCIPNIDEPNVSYCTLQVGEEPPPTPNDPFLQQLAELSNSKQQPSTTTISFHGNTPPQRAAESSIWPPSSSEDLKPPPSEDLIVPSFTSYDGESQITSPPAVPPQNPSPSGTWYAKQIFYKHRLCLCCHFGMTGGALL